MLVLPSDSSNEAFGIVQLEAMAAGRIALAFDQPRSGMVGRAPARLPWTQTPEGLPEASEIGGSAGLASQTEAQSRARYRTLLPGGVLQLDGWAMPWKPVRSPSQ